MTFKLYAVAKGCPGAITGVMRTKGTYKSASSQELHRDFNLSEAKRK